MNLYLAAFLIAPIIALAIRARLKAKTSIWLIFAAYIAVGWLLINLAVREHFASLDELAQNNPSSTKEALDEWQDDGAAQVFALYFGWSYAAIYFAVCFLAAYFIRTLRKRRL